MLRFDVAPYAAAFFLIAAFSFFFDRFATLFRLILPSARMFMLPMMLLRHHACAYAATPLPRRTYDMLSALLRCLCYADS